MTEETQITWVTTGQAAAIRGVIPRTIGAYADRGYIRSYKLPSGHRRVCLEDVLAITESAKAATR
jgi:DNA-binding transcriptional MerR regulator